jgi:hypothetical protein
VVSEWPRMFVELGNMNCVIIKFLSPAGFTTSDYERAQLYNSNSVYYLIGVFLHLGIWIFVGLGPFSMVMIAGLHLFLVFQHDSIISSFFQYDQHVLSAK